MQIWPWGKAVSQSVTRGSGTYILNSFREDYLASVYHPPL
jgi:hypothetical protein